jgi:release factor glutamine methyltransferase
LSVFSHTTTIEQACKLAASQFEQVNHAMPALDAGVLLCAVLDKPRSYLFTWPEKCLTEQQAATFGRYVSRRVLGEPVAYIVGEREFWSLPLKVAPSTLIPRPDTEVLVELALERIPTHSCSILDLGTGTGAVALAIASERPQHHVVAADLMPEACELARLNAQRLNLENVTIVQSDWLDNVDRDIEFSCIVSNPPYIDAQDPHLNQGDVQFEPSSALIASDSGLADIKIIAKQSYDALNGSGWLLIEHGHTQGQSVRQILNDQGYFQVETKPDYAGLDRVTMGCRSTK